MKWDEEQRVAERVAERAAAGLEVPADLLRAVPPRTLHCNGKEFRRYRSLAKTARPRSFCCLPIASPVGWVYTTWLIVTNFTDATYTAFMVALSIAFNQVGGTGPVTWLMVADAFGSCVYLIDLVMGFHTGVLVRWDSRALVVRDGRAAASFYVRHGTFVADALASLPAFAQLVILASGESRHLLRYIYIFRLMRLYRVFRLIKNIAPGSGSGLIRPLVAMVSTSALSLITAIFSLLVLVNLMGCMWWNMAVGEGLEYSWAAHIQNKEYDLLTASNFQRWVISCYFSLTTMVTIGYGDITPVTISEAGLVLLFEVVGVAFFGYLLNVVTTVLSASGSAAKRSQAVRQKLQDAEEMMRGLHLSASLVRKIRGYFAEHWQPDHGMTRDPRYQLYLELPTSLRKRIIQQRQESALAELGFYPDGMTPMQRQQAGRMLAAASSPVRLAAGQQLFEAVLEFKAADRDDLDWSGPSYFILDEGEMRALQPGDSTRVHTHALTGRVDFSGPAVIGMSALFCPAAMAAPEEDNGSADGGSSAKEAPQDGPGVAGGDGAAGGGGPRSSWQPSNDWQQRAVALTECHLWRVDSRQLFGDLRKHHPLLLLSLVRQLLRTLGVRVDDGDSSNAAGNGAAWGSVPGTSTGAAWDFPAPHGEHLTEAPQQELGMAAAAAVAVAAPQQQQTPKSSVVARLQQLQAELAAAVAAGQQGKEEQQRHQGEQVGKQGSALEKVSVLGGGQASWRTSGGGSLFEPSVTLAPASSSGSALLGADVWHTED